MDKIRPLLGTTSKFSEAYPEIDTAKITVNTDLFGSHERNKDYRLTHFNERHMSSKIDCPNPMCKRGGVDIDSFLRSMVVQGKTELSEKISCNGDEGSPQGRRRGRRCDNFFEIRAEITYKTSEE